MTRKVSVGLEADVAGFIGPVEASAHATEKLDDHVNELDRSISKIPADALKAGAALKLMSADTKDLGAHIGQIGDRSTSLTILDARIRNSRAEVRKLTAEFIRTGDVDVFARLGKSSGDLKGLTDLRRTLTNALEDGGREGAKTFASAFQGGIMDSFNALPGEAKLALVNLAAAIGISLAAMLGAVVNGAILGALGGGALAAGIAAQASDPRVRAAFGQLGTHIVHDFSDATAGFARPLVYAAHAFGKAWDESFPGIKAGLEWISKFIVPLSDGLSKAFKNMQPGFLNALQAAGPILQAIADELPNFGTVLSKAFNDLAKNSKGAEYGIRTLFFIVETLILGVSKAISVLSGLYASLVHISAAAVAAGAALLGWVPLIGPALEKANKKFKDTEAGANHVASGLHELAVQAGLIPPTADELAASIGKIGTAFSQVGQSIEGAFTSQVLNQMLGLDHATFRWEESLNGLNDAVKQNGRSLQGHSDKVIRNKEAILAAVEANANLYAQNLLSGDSAEVAGQKYEANAAQLRKQAIAAGFNAKEVDGLVGKYGKIPSKVQTILATIGLTEALNHLGGILTDFRNLNDKDFYTKYHVDTFYTTHYGTVGGKEPPAQYALGGIRHAAMGMIVGPSSPGTLIGEPQTGGEALIPLRGLTQHAAMGLMRTTGAGYGLDVVPRGGGGGTVKVELLVKDGSSGRSGLASLIAHMANTGELQLTSRVIVN